MRGRPGRHCQKYKKPDVTAPWSSGGKRWSSISNARNLAQLVAHKQVHLSILRRLSLSVAKGNSEALKKTA